MSDIVIERHPSAERLEQLAVTRWPVWSHQEASFPWHYDETETSYLLEGEVIVTPADGVPVRIGKGDLVTFAAGLSCTWEIRQAVRKHYRFG